jgi:hypothetical protein
VIIDSVKLQRAVTEPFSDPINSPYFDGSPYSMSGNGKYEPHNYTNALPSNLNCIPPGQGGGCVKSGPFKEYIFLATLFKKIC